MTYDPQQQGSGYYPQAQQPQPPYYAPPPPGILPYGGPMPNPRPTAATVLAIIGIVLAVIAILNHGIGLLMAATGGSIMGRVVAHTPWMYADSAISLVLWTLELIACVGLLQMSATARKAMIVWAIFYIVWLVICLGMAFTVTVPTMIRNGRNIQQGVESAAYFGVACFIIILSVFPILILSMLSRANVVVAYERPVQY